MYLYKRFRMHESEAVQIAARKTPWRCKGDEASRSTSLSIKQFAVAPPICPSIDRGRPRSHGSRGPRHTAGARRARPSRAHCSKKLCTAKSGPPSALGHSRPTSNGSPE